MQFFSRLRALPFTGLYRFCPGHVQIRWSSHDTHRHNSGDASTHPDI